mmetsp:Transcript_9501/g.23324  ORF Transcript_9501/g.23324 Transcript_9501/m.23324 type:complete len:217 (-) Transcript_9501:344-994(-)
MLSTVPYEAFFCAGELLVVDVVPWLAVWLSPPPSSEAAACCSCPLLSSPATCSCPPLFFFICCCASEEVSAFTEQPFRSRQRRELQTGSVSCFCGKDCSSSCPVLALSSRAIASRRSARASSRSRSASEFFSRFWLCQVRKISYNAFPSNMFSPQPRVHSGAKPSPSRQKFSAISSTRLSEGRVFRKPTWVANSRLRRAVGCSSTCCKKFVAWAFL